LSVENKPQFNHVKLAILDDFLAINNSQYVSVLVSSSVCSWKHVYYTSCGSKFIRM